MPRDKWTTQAWLNEFGPTYGIKSIKYVQQMCIGHIVSNTGHKSHLPDGWEAIKLTETGGQGIWLIQRTEDNPDETGKIHTVQKLDTDPKTKKKKS
jgi:hypothetical protein